MSNTIATLIHNDTAAGISSTAVFGIPEDLNNQTEELILMRAPFRYSLRRMWGPDPTNVLLGCLMNPSTANHKVNDPTLAGWQIRARAWGYDGFVIVNAYAHRSPDQKTLRTAVDPVGPMNDHFIKLECKRAKTVVCGWGVPPKPVRHRTIVVRDMLRALGIQLHALHINNDGSPKHPLYVNHKKRPFAWNP